MKKLCWFGLALILTMLVASCSGSHAYQTQANQDLLAENWMQRLNTNPNIWVKGADRWFFTGTPGHIVDYAKRAPYSKAISSMMVRVPNFTDLRVSGSYTIQIVGGMEANYVEILGPNAGVRQIAVQVSNDTLYINPIANCKANLDDVIVRIGVRTLHKIVDLGSGNLYARGLCSKNLTIFSGCNGTMLLSGTIRLRQITQNGSGSVTVLGVISPDVIVKDNGSGNINLNGRIGVRSITNMGSGYVNIIGADTDMLTIDAGGSSKTNVVGYANLKKVTASGKSRVYLYWVKSNGLTIQQSDQANVGVAGCVTNLSVNLTGGSCFKGINLLANSIYIRTSGASHANISANQKVFASSVDNSSIYYAGSPSNISRFISGNATIIPVWTTSIPNPPMPSYLRNAWNFKGQNVK